MTATLGGMPASFTSISIFAPSGAPTGAVALDSAGVAYQLSTTWSASNVPSYSWVALPAPPGVGNTWLSISTAGAGLIMGIDAAGAAWQWNNATGAWVALPVHP